VVLVVLVVLVVVAVLVVLLVVVAVAKEHGVVVEHGLADLEVVVLESQAVLEHPAAIPPMALRTPEPPMLVVMVVQGITIMRAKVQVCTVAQVVKAGM
jgi:hypothetical protein